MIRVDDGRRLLYLMSVVMEGGDQLLQERDIHRLACAARDLLGFQLRLITEPIVYSSTVDTYLRELVRGGSLEDTLQVRDGLVPRYAYALSGTGRYRAALIADRLERESPGLRAAIARLITRQTPCRRAL